MNKFAVVYRNNTTFAKCMPGLVEALKASGCEVSLTVFPEGTPENEIAHLHVAQDVKVLCDETFLRAKKESGKPLDKIFYTIDSFLRDIPHRAIGKMGHRNNVGKGAKDVFVGVVFEILASGASMPEEIMVASSNMADHLSNRDYPSSRPSHAEVANEVAGWCQGIFPGIKVRVTPVMQSVPNGWLVTDRHHCQTKDPRGISAEVIIRLPLETAVYDLAEKGLLKIPEDLQAMFEESILEHYRLNKAS